MKNIKYLFTSIILGAIVFASCEKNDPILFQNEDSFVAFEGTAGSVVEATVVDGVPVENEIEIKVMVVTLNSTPVTVDFEFSTEGIANPAIENEAFVLLNDSKTLSFPDGWGYASIRIRTIDDDIFTGNRAVNIKLTGNSAGYDLGRESTYRLTVVDNEHPLNIVLGSYSVEGVSYFYGDFSTTIETSAIEGNLEQVEFKLNQLLIGWGVPDDYMVIADVDLDEMTFNIETGQEYPTFGYGPFVLSAFDLDWEDVDDGEYITGTIDEDGNITQSDHRIAFRITAGGNEGLHFDILDPGIEWTKTDKKSAVASRPAPKTGRVPRSR